MENPVQGSARITQFGIKFNTEGESQCSFGPDGKSSSHHPTERELPWVRWKMRNEKWHRFTLEICWSKTKIETFRAWYQIPAHSSWLAHVDKKATKTQHRKTQSESQWWWWCRGWLLAVRERHRMMIMMMGGMKCECEMENSSTGFSLSVCIVVLHIIVVCDE